MTTKGLRARNMKNARIGFGPMAVVLGAVAATLPLGCGAEVRPATGQRMISVSSDLLPGRDFDDDVAFGHRFPLAIHAVPASQQVGGRAALEVLLLQEQEWRPAFFPP